MKKIYLVLFVILSVFVFSCKDNLISDDLISDNLISDDLSSSQNSGAGQVKVFVKQSRLFGPDVSDVDWTVELYKGNDNYSGKNENGYYLFSGLSDGTYNIRVSGKTGDVEKFTGSAQVTITNGNSVSVNVPIVAKKTDKESGDGAEKKGYATITMDMSDELLSLLNSMGPDAFFVAQLYSVDGNDNDTEYITASLVETSTDVQGEIGSIEIFDNQKVEFKFMNPEDKLFISEIPTGYYYLTFFGLENFSFTIKLKDNLVEIGDGLTTNIVLTQNDYELVQWNSYSQGMPTVFYVDNGDGNHIRNTNGGIDTYAGTSLSNPLGFRNINDNTSDGNILYLISDVNTYVDDQNRISYISGKTITSFGTDIFSIINNNENFSLKFERTFLKNIKLTNTTGNGFSLLQCPVDGTVILDTPIVQDSNTDSTVLMSKSSNLEIGQNFSGELGICLSSENWQLGDTVVTFENGKPNNANFYISESYDSQGNSLASKFYIDDNGKLAQYDASTQWVNFAWNDECPCLITQTQAKNKTYTSIYDNYGYSLFDFNGISTYDEENQTWYFINNSGDSFALYSVTNPKNYEGVVEATLIEIGDMPDELSNITAMDYDNGKLYFGYWFNSGYSFYSYDVSKEILTTINSLSIQMTDANSSDLTSFMVKGNDFYFATTFTDTNQPEQVATHSAIWKYTLSEDTSDNGYHLIPAESYVSGVGECPVPYYLTQYDNNLSIDNSFPKNSTFRITDLYSDGNSVYGLLANYEDKVTLQNTHSDIHMRGSVFKLEQNTSRQNNTSEPMMNANHSGLRKSFPLTSINLATAKKYFILPRKIVGILNKKLVIVDDGMVPDSNDCNVDRFVLFDLFNLADEISETIDVAVPFSTNGFATTSTPKTFYTSNSLFN